MPTKDDRTKLFFQDQFNQIEDAHVMVVGLGGVGSFAVEALARTGVKKLTLTDFDVFDITNINRQVGALHSTIGKEKLSVLKERILDINPAAEVTLLSEFDLENTLKTLPTADFVIDAIDTITYKIMLAKACLEGNIPFITCMGAANKMDPKQLQVSTLKKTEYDPVARVMRQKMRKLGLSIDFPVVFSKEEPFKQQQVLNDTSIRKKDMPPSSVIFVPATMGLIAANEAIKHLVNKKQNR